MMMERICIHFEHKSKPSRMILRWESEKFVFEIYHPASNTDEEAMTPTL